MTAIKLTTEKATGVQGKCSPESVMKAVLEGFKTPRDWSMNQAIEKFLKTYKQKLGEEVKNEVLKEITTQEGIEAIIQLQCKYIELMALEIRLNHADKKCRMAADNARLTLEELEGIDSEIDWEYDPFRFLILKSPQDNNIAAFKKVVQFVQSLADGSVSPGSVSNGNLPKEIEKVITQMSGIKMREFLTDIAELMVENGDTGRELIREICEKADSAQEIITQQDAPGPLKFLATIILKYARKADKKGEESHDKYN